MGGGLKEFASVLSLPIVPRLCHRKPERKVSGANATKDMMAMDIWTVKVAEKFLQCATQKGTCLENVEEQLEWLF